MSGNTTIIYKTITKEVLRKGAAVVTQGTVSSGTTGAVGGNVLNVGPARTFTTLAAALAGTIAPNTTILLDAGTYTAAVAVPNSLPASTVIRGTVVNGRLATILDFQGGNEAGYTLASGGKGGLFITGPITIDSLWLKNAGGPVPATGGSQGDGGEAAIRAEAFPTRGTLTLNNCAFDGNAEGLFIGVLGTNVDLVCNNCNFDFVTSNGQSRDGYSHSLYVEARTVTLNNCSSAGNIYGNTFKFRGGTTGGAVVINGGTIAAGAGRAIDRCDGGALTVNGARITATGTGQNLISYAEEGTTNGAVDVYFNNCVIVTQGNSSIVNAAAGTTMHFVNCTQEWYGTSPTLILQGPGAITGLATSGASMAASAPPPAQPTYPANGGAGSTSTTGSGNTGTGGGTPVTIPALTTVGSGPDAFTLVLSEDAYQGDCTFAFSVDGVQVGGTQTVVAQHSAQQTQKFVFLGTFGAGQHTITIDFLNDLFSGTAGGGDRNIYVESILYNGLTIVGSEKIIYDGGNTSYQVPATAAVGSGGTTPTNPTATPGPSGAARLTGSATGSIKLSRYVVQDNFGGGVFASVQMVNSNLSTNGGASLSVNDPSGYFRLGQDGGYFDFNNGKSPNLPPIGSHTITVTCTNGSSSVAQDFVINSIYEAPPNSITFNPVQISSSNNPGAPVGTATAFDADGIYIWSLANSANGAFAINSQTGQVTTNATLTAQVYSITIQVMDGTANKVYQQSFNIPVVSGNVIAPSAMSIAVTPGITNAAWGSGNGGSTIGHYPGVVATPSIDTSLFTNGAPTWSIVQSAANRFAIDPKTGVVTARTYLSAQTETITISCSDGINSCTNTAQVVIVWAQGPTVDVGPGQTYAHMDDFYAVVWNDSSAGNGAKWDGTIINVHPSPDPNYYINDLYNLPARGQIFHPVKIIGVGASTNGARPLFGFGAGYYGKAIFDVKGVDIFIQYIEIAGATAYSMSNIAGIFKDSGMGNIWMDNLYIHDCDNAFQGGDSFNSDGSVAFDVGVNFSMTNSEIAMCSNGMPGRTHNMYFGLGDSVYLENVFSWGAHHGHEFKSRCAKTTLKNCRFADTEYGHGSAQVDIPVGGEALVDGCYFQKSPGGEASWSLHYGGEWDNRSQFRYVNNIIVQNCTFVNYSIPQSLGGQAWACVNNGVVSPITGQYGTMTATNNKFYGYDTGCRVVGNDTYNKTSTPVVETGSVILSTPPAMDISHPTTGAVPGTPTPFIYDPDISLNVMDLRIAPSTPIGTTIATATWPSTPQCPRPAPQWSLLFSPNNKYSIDANGNLKVAGTLTPGVDVIQIASASSWANWFYVIVQ